MVSRETIKFLATQFLSEVRDAVKSGLGETVYHNPSCLYRESTKIASNEGSSSILMEFKEPPIQEFDTYEVDIWCQRRLLGMPLVENDSANIQGLKQALWEAGVDRLDVQPYLRSLIRQWCALQEPYRFPECSVALLEEFATAVVGGQVVTESIDGIASMILADGKINSTKRSPYVPSPRMN